MGNDGAASQLKTIRTTTKFREFVAISVRMSVRIRVARETGKLSSVTTVANAKAACSRVKMIRDGGPGELDPGSVFTKATEGVGSH